MTWPPNPSALVLGSIVAGLVAVAVASWLQRDRTRGARSFTFLVLAAALWVLAEGGQAVAVDPLARTTWLQLRVLAVAALPVAFLVFANDDTRRFARLDRHAVALLLVIPAVTVGLAWTFPLQEFLWRSVEADGERLVLQHGPWWWVSAAFGYATAATATFVLARARAAAPRASRAPTTWALAGAVVVWAVHATTAGFGARLAVDPTPFAVALAVVVGGRGLLTHRVRDVVPMARDMVLRRLPDPVLVLDPWRRVLQANVAAADVFDVGQPDDLVGRDADDVLRDQPTLRRAVEVGASVELAVEWSRDQVERHFLARTTPLPDRRGRRSGQLLHLQDVGREMLAERERRATERDLAEQRGYTAVLLEGSQGLVAGRAVDALLEDLLRRAAEVVGTPHAALFRVAPDGRDLEPWRALGRLDAGFDGRLPIGTDLAGRAWRDRRRVLVADYPSWPERASGPAPSWARAALAVPLLDGDGAYGALVLVRPRTDRRPFSGGEEAVAVGIARLGAVAVAREHRSVEIDGLRREADAHADLDAALRAAASLHDRLDRLLAAARAAVGFARAVVWLPTEDGTALRPERTFGFGSGVDVAIEPVRIDGRVPLLDAAFGTAEEHVLDGAEPVPERWRARGGVAASRLVRSRAPAVLPLVSRGRTVGVLAVDDPVDRTPLAPRMAALRRFATLAALLVDLERAAVSRAPRAAAAPPWRFEVVDLADVVRRAARVADAGADRRPEVDLVLDVPSGLPPVIGDRGRLVRVAVHLIARALTTTRAGSVTLCLGRDHDLELGDALVLRVRDTGEGGDAAALAKAFEPPPSGASTVLHACKRTVERHGGRLWSNRSPRGGATVAIVLPLVAAGSAPVATPARAG